MTDDVCSQKRAGRVPRFPVVELISRDDEGFDTHPMRFLDGVVIGTGINDDDTWADRRADDRRQGSTQQISGIERKDRDSDGQPLGTFV